MIGKGVTDSQLTLIGCIEKSGRLRRQADAKRAAAEESGEILSPSPAQPLVEPAPLPASTPASTIMQREPLVAQIRRHRETHPTAAESARERWEAEQKRMHGCNYVDGICTVHGSAPPKEKP